MLKAVREAVGPFFPIEFQLSGAEFVEEGYDLDEGVRIAQQLEPYIDLLHVTAGTYQRTFGITTPPCSPTMAVTSIHSIPSLFLPQAFFQ